MFLFKLDGNFAIQLNEEQNEAKLLDLRNSTKASVLYSVKDSPFSGCGNPCEIHLVLQIFQEKQAIRRGGIGFTWLVSSQ